jgi:hypothetical protein
MWIEHDGDSEKGCQCTRVKTRMADGAVSSGAQQVATRYLLPETHLRPLPSCPAFGDSTTTIQASEPGKRWRNLVAEAKGWSVVNTGINGTPLQNTVQSSVSRAGGPAKDNGRDTYQDRVLAHDPAWLLILYGLNDLRLDAPAFTSELYQNDLEEVIDGLIAGGVPAEPSQPV